LVAGEVPQGRAARAGTVAAVDGPRGSGCPTGALRVGEDARDPPMNISPTHRRVLQGRRPSVERTTARRRPSARKRPGAGYSPYRLPVARVGSAVDVILTAAIGARHVADDRIRTGVA